MTRRELFALRAYQVLTLVALPLTLARVGWLAWRRGGYGERWWQRLGLAKRENPRRPVWFHAVSVGEVAAAVPVIEALRKRHADLPVLVTTTTPTACQVVQRLGLEHRYLPFDAPPCVALFLRQVQPAMLVLVEKEFWPNLVHGCVRRDIPVLLANARMTEAAAKGYRRALFLFAPVFRSLAFVTAQSAADTARLATLQVPAARMNVVGNTKNDAAAATTAPRMSGDRPAWIAVSTHPGEEDVVLETHLSLLREHPDLLLILAPRHPHRRQEVLDLAGSHGLHVNSRSVDGVADPGAQVFLVDTIGELGIALASTSIAFIGGSLVDTGGHNPVEAILQDSAVLTGPHFVNFADAYEELTACGAARVTDAKTLESIVLELLGDADKLRRQRSSAQEWLRSRQGASSQVADAILQRLPGPT